MQLLEPQQEEWAVVDGLERYLVSSLGIVVNTERKRELTPSPDKNGYMRVGLSKNGRVYFVYVHRLVAKCFLEGYQEGTEVKHRDEDKTNNSVTNLMLGGGCRTGVVKNV